MSKAATNKIVRQTSRMEYVPLERMRVREGISQRDFRPAWAMKLAKGFNLDKMPDPVVNKVGEWYWIVDGQHRVAALKQWFGDWKGQQIQCQVYRGLSEKQEADLYLALNTKKADSAFERFVIALTAELEDEINVDAIVQKNGLKVSQQRGESAVSCVGTLLKVYRRGAECLDKALKIAQESFGDSGLEADVIEALGLQVGRYNGLLDPTKAIRAYSKKRAGVSGFRNRAERIRQQMGASKSMCLAAALTEAYNQERAGKKLTGWWKE